MRIVQKYIFDILRTPEVHGGTQNVSVGPQIRGHLRIFDWSKALIWKWFVYTKGHIHMPYANFG